MKAEKKVLAEKITQAVMQEIATEEPGKKISKSIGKAAKELAGKIIKARKKVKVKGKKDKKKGEIQELTPSPLIVENED